MSNVISKKYSKALYLVTKAKEVTGIVVQELETVYTATHTDMGLRSFFDDPLTESHTKIASLQQALVKHSLTSETLDFVSLLVKNKRFSFLGSIISDLHVLMDKDRGVQRGIIRSAQNLPQDIIRSVEAEFEKILKTNVQLQFQNSPELLGGIVAEVAGLTFDDSLENHLNKLSDNLVRH